MATALTTYAQQLRSLRVQLWARIRKIGEEEKPGGLGELEELAIRVDAAIGNIGELAASVKGLPDEELENLRRRVVLLQEPERPVAAPKSEVAAITRGRGRAGRVSTEEEKQAILHLFNARGLTDENEIKRVLANELGFPDVTLRSIKMIITHILKEEASDLAEIGEPDDTALTSKAVGPQASATTEE